ncbi:Hpt domain protein [compost metagenome]
MASSTVAATVNRVRATGLKALLADLASSNLADLAQLRYSSDNLSALVDVAHRMKGGARIVRAQALVASCERLEAQCTQRPADTSQVR